MQKGERIAIRGASGSGKSSVLKMIMGFTQATEGEVFIDEKKLSELNIKAVRQRIGWLPQEFPRFTGTVAELFNTLFRFRANQNLKPAPDELESKLRVFGMPASIMDKNMEALSVGQKQRIGAMICLLLQRELLLLDEPTSALDDQAKAILIRELFESKSQSLISASHDPAWLQRCDRIIDLS